MDLSQHTVHVRDEPGAADTPPAAKARRHPRSAQAVYAWLACLRRHSEFEHETYIHEFDDADGSSEYTIEAPQAIDDNQEVHSLNGGRG